MPTPIRIVLENPAFGILARVVLTSFFWIAGLFGLVRFGALVAKVEEQRLPSPRRIAAAMIATELAGSALLVTDAGSMGWLGAGALGVFTVLSIPLGHPFWRYEPPRKTDEMQIALEHLSVVGGLMAAAALTVR